MNIEIVRCQSRGDGIDEIFKTMKNRQKQNMQVLVVPEKFEVSAERAMFESTGMRAVFNMDITTFDQMADTYVIDRNIQYLSKSAGVMLVQKIALEKGKELKVLNKSTTFNGFSENIFNTIMLLKSSGVTPEKLLDGAQQLADVSHLKLCDIQKLYFEYENALKGRYIDSANKLDKLNAELQFDDSIKNTDFYIYSPKVTKQLLKVMQTLIKCAHSVTFLVDENKENNNYRRICELCQTLAPFSERVAERKPLEKVIKYGQCCATGELAFYRAKDLKAEVENVCSLIAESNSRYRDNYVLVAGLDKYKNQIIETFAECNMPIFFSLEEPLSTLSPVVFVLQMIDLACEFRVDKVLSVLKSGFFDVDKCKVYNFELYLKKWGINEKNFKSANKPNDELFDDYSVVYSYFNALFDVLKEDLVCATNISEILQALDKFLADINFAEKVSLQAKKLSQVGQQQKAKMYEQVTKKIGKVSQQLVEILGLNSMPLKDFKIIFKAGLDSATVKTPPLTIDCVFVGDVAASMLYRAKNLYVLGAVEGDFPVANQDCGMVLDDEIEGMRGVCELEPTIKQANVENKQCVQNNLVCGKNIMISYPVSVFSVEQKPSSFLTEIMRSVSGICGSTAAFVDCREVNMLDSPEDVGKIIITSGRAERVIREVDADIEKMNVATIYNRVCGVANKMGVNFERKTLENIPREVKNPSVSQLQEYYSCPFKNFIHYGLRLKEVADNSFKAVDVGTFMHKVAELYGDYLIVRKLKYLDNEAIFEYLIKETFKFFGLEDFGRKTKNIDAQNYTILKNLSNSATLMLRAINEQNKNSDFKVTWVEKPISFKISCNGKEISISGKIDRVDTYGDYVRIIDYKTGSDKFSIDQLMCGRQIQLFVYLGAIAELEKLNPVGVYYFKIKDEFTSPYSDKEFLSTYKLNGITTDEEQVVLAQDTSLCAEKLSSDIIPIKIKESYANGEFGLDGRSSRTATKDELKGYIDYAYKIFERGVVEIEEGNIQISPYDGTCEFCPYKGVLCDGNDRTRRYAGKKKNSKTAKLAKKGK